MYRTENQHKIKKELFLWKPGAVVDFSRRTDAPVVIYDKNGPLAVVTPYRKPAVSSTPRILHAHGETDELADTKTWPMVDSEEEEAVKPRWRRGVERISRSGIFKLARASALIGFLTQVKG